MWTRAQIRRRIDSAAIEAAIARAEASTSAEIRVCLAPFFWGDVRRTADLAFERLGVAATQGRSGVLVFVVPSRRRFVVIGDVEVQRRLGDALWAELVALLGAAFREGRYTEGLVAAVDTLGERLAPAFPRAAGDVNELPDAVEIAGADARRP